MADRHSDCKGNGGDLGVFPAGHMVEEFERALRQIRPGERTGVFTTPFGFHIAYLRAFEPAGAAEFEDVKGDVERVLAAMAEHREFLRAIDELRRSATIMFTPEESLVSQ